MLEGTRSQQLKRGQTLKFISVIIPTEIKHMVMGLWQGAGQNPVAKDQAPCDMDFSYQLTQK